MSSSSRFEFPLGPGSQEPLLEPGDIRFSAAITPGPLQAEIKRADFEHRSHTVTGQSLEPYIGEYNYIIGQSKYYLQRRTMQEQRTMNERKQTADKKGHSLNLDEELVVFFSQHTRELEYEEPVPSRPVSSTGAFYQPASSIQKPHDYLKAQMTSMVLQFTDTRTATRDKYDLLGVTDRGMSEEYMAGAILNALTQMQAKKSPPTLNFPTNVRFFNQIVYFKDMPDELDAEVKLPQTAIPILGNTLKELIINNKSWIITDGAKQPFANMLGDALTKANKQEKELTESLRKRMHLTGIVTMREDDKGKRGDINFDNLDPPCNLLPLTLREQKHLNEIISPYSGMTLWLVMENSDTRMKEKIIWHISQLLKIPAVMVQLHQSKQHLGPGQQYRTNRLKVEVLCPMREQLPDDWSCIFNLQSKKRTLHNLILTMANTYFDNKDINFKQWNTLTPSIFLQSHELVNHRLNNFYLEDEDYKQPVTAKIIDRTIRYALISGNREVVETIVNNPIFQKIVIKRREKVVEDIFQKAAQEVYLFSRVILAIKGRNFEFGSNYRKVRDFLQKFFETIFGRGFIWETPSEHIPLAASRNLDEEDRKPLTPEEEEKKIIYRAYKYYFSEYVFVWALMCLKFDVALLFLEYSGVQKQDFDQGEVYQTNKGIFQIGNAVAASKIMTGMSKILKEDTSVSKEEHETMKEHAIKYENIAISLLNEALKHGLNLNDIFNKELPFWNGIKLIDLAKQARLKNFFSERSITRFVNNSWEGLDNRPNYKTSLFSEPVTTVKNLVQRIVTPRHTFFLHVTFYTLFLCMVILLICFYWRDETPGQRDAIFYVYILYVVTNYLDEFYQYNSFVREKFKNKRESKKKNWAKFKENIRIFKAALIEYLSSIWNLLDIIIVIGFIISVVTYFLFRTTTALLVSDLQVPSPFVFVRIYFGLFSTLFYIRYFQYILIFPGIGPLVYTCLFAFKRMLYFLVIIVLVALCFGIAEVALTTTSNSTALNSESELTQRFLVFLFYPIFQIFGEYFLQEFENQNFRLIQIENNSLFGSPSQANFWTTTQFLTFVAIIIWILIANVLLLNLMIAYFSQIYEDVSKNAASIYLLNFIEIVEEYKEKPFFPAPFNTIIYVYRAIAWGINQRRRKAKKTVNKEDKRRQTLMFNNMKQNRHFITSPVSFGWHIELTFADYYWKKIGDNRYAEKAMQEKEQDEIAEYIEMQESTSVQRLFV